MKTEITSPPPPASLEEAGSLSPRRKSQGGREGGVTFRVVVMCLGLAVFFGYLIPIVDLKLRNTMLGGTQMPVGGIAVLLVLLGLNPLLSALRSEWRFSRNEMLTVYISCLFSCLVPGSGADTSFVPNLITPFYLATRENKWLEFLLPYIKPWMTPAIKAVDGQSQYNFAVVEPWFTGSTGAIPWQAWAVPLIAWSALILAVYVMLGCFSVLLRAQWSEHEALSFPLLRVPLALTEEGEQAAKSGLGAALLHSPMMWCGFGVAVLIQGLNGLNLYFPDVPQVPLTVDTGQLYTEPPWNQIAWATPYVYPMAIGISYLLASEVSLSLWFFFWFFKLQLIAAYYLGYMPSTLPTTPTSQSKTFVGHQQIGAFLVFAAIVLWTGREHFAHVLRRSLSPVRVQAGEAEKSEALSYPIAFWGFAISFAFVVGWSCLAGIRPDIALTLWLLYLVITICLTRVVAEGGLLFVVHSWIPLGILGQLLNSGPNTWLPPSSIVPAAVIQSSMMNLIRGFLLPSFVQSLKLAHDQKIKAKPLLRLIAGVILISFGMALWSNVRLGYENGGLQLADQSFVMGQPRNVATISNDLLAGARGVSWTNWVWLAVGGVGTYALMLARARFPWFALHPIGYLMGLTFPMHLLWFSTLVGWACKVAIMRFGGADTYRRVTPFFLGLILGDVCMMLLWLCIDGWQGRVSHQLMPG